MCRFGIRGFSKEGARRRDPIGQFYWFSLGIHVWLLTAELKSKASAFRCQLYHYGLPICVLTARKAFANECHVCAVDFDV